MDFSSATHLALLKLGQGASQLLLARLPRASLQLLPLPGLPLLCLLLPPLLLLFGTLPFQYRQTLLFPASPEWVSL